MHGSGTAGRVGGPPFVSRRSDRVTGGEQPTTQRRNPTTWRLLDTGALGAVENTAFDEALLAACEEGYEQSTLRFLEWSEPCALVGLHQVVEREVREAYCRRNGIAVNRRITGGGAIFCDAGQLGWEIFARKGAPGLPNRPEDLYALLCEGAVRGLRHLGVAASFRLREDIEVGGRKISGTGRTDTCNAILVQGTLFLDFDVETMARALRVPAETRKGTERDSIRERITCLHWELGRTPDRTWVKRAIAEGIGEALGVRFRAGGPTPREERLLRGLLPRFASPQWIYATRRPAASVAPVASPRP